MSFYDGPYSLTLQILTTLLIIELAWGIALLVAMSESMKSVRRQRCDIQKPMIGTSAVTRTFTTHGRWLPGANLRGVKAHPSLAKTDSFMGLLSNERSEFITVPQD
jgi:hypothetical protein